MRIVWTKRSIDNLDLIDEYISQDNPVAAAEVVSHIFESVQKLKNHPRLGKPGRAATPRELIISDSPYIVPYVIEDNSIMILRVVHATMKWPKLL